MPKFSKEVYFILPKEKVPIRKVFRIEAKDRKEAGLILNKMTELYNKKLEGSKPVDIVRKLKSVPKEVGSIDERTVKILKRAFKLKSN